MNKLFLHIFNLDTGLSFLPLYILFIVGKVALLMAQQLVDFFRVNLNILHHVP